MDTVLATIGVLGLLWLGCGLAAAIAVKRLMPPLDGWHGATGGFLAMILIITFAAGPVSLSFVVALWRMRK